MALERGFRRILIVLSVVVLVLGVALEAALMLPHATVQVTLKDGREFTLERHTKKEFLTERDSLALALKNGDGVYKGGRKEPLVTAAPMKKWTVRMKDGTVHHGVLAPSAEEARRKIERLPALTGDISKDLAAVPPPPDWISAEDAATIMEVKVTRGPEYWWWSDSNGMKIAGGLVVLLWIAFYTVRWIARGFARR